MTITNHTSTPFDERHPPGAWPSGDLADLPLTPRSVGDLFIVYTAGETVFNPPQIYVADDAGTAWLLGNPTPPAQVGLTIYATTPTTVEVGSDTLKFQQEFYDPLNMFDSAVSEDTITIQQAGKYYIHLTVYAAFVDDGPVSSFLPVIYIVRTPPNTRLGYEYATDLAQFIRVSYTHHFSITMMFIADLDVSDQLKTIFQNDTDYVGDALAHLTMIRVGD